MLTTFRLVEKAGNHNRSSDVSQRRIGEYSACRSDGDKP